MRMTMRMTSWVAGVVLLVGGLSAQARRIQPDPSYRILLDVDYHGGKEAHPERHRLDLFLPKKPTKHPLLMFIHGGSWRVGSKEYCHGLGDSLARQGIPVALINYRLDKATHPEQILDCARAAAWLVKHAKEHGFSDRIFLGGHSAGGHLASLLALNARFLAEFDLLPERILGVVSVSGIYDVRFGIDLFVRVFGKSPKERADASPAAHVTALAPPFLVFWAEKEMSGLELSARVFVQKLERAGVPVRSAEVLGKDHISILTSLGDPDSPSAKSLLEFLAAPPKRAAPKPGDPAPSSPSSGESKGAPAPIR